jgi:hypothetical protein
VFRPENCGDSRMTSSTEPRKGMPSPRLDEAEFKRRFLTQFIDPAFDSVSPELSRVADVAWDAYYNSRKSPRTRKAGKGFADPDYDLSIDWINARDAINRAQDEHDSADGPARFLLINASSRSEHTCPGEMSVVSLHADGPTSHRRRTEYRCPGARPEPAFF